MKRRDKRDVLLKKNKAWRQYDLRAAKKVKKTIISLALALLWRFFNAGGTSAEAASNGGE
jgi:hypothetical protein